MIIEEIQVNSLEKALKHTIMYGARAYAKKKENLINRRVGGEYFK